MERQGTQWVAWARAFLLKWRGAARRLSEWFMTRVPRCFRDRNPNRLAGIETDWGPDACNCSSVGTALGHKVWIRRHRHFFFAGLDEIHSTSAAFRPTWKHRSDRIGGEIGGARYRNAWLHACRSSRFHIKIWTTLTHNCLGIPRSTPTMKPESPKAQAGTS